MRHALFMMERTGSERDCAAQPKMRRLVQAFGINVR